jgi:hypothetical protein
MHRFKDERGFTLPQALVAAMMLLFVGLAIGALIQNIRASEIRPVTTQALLNSRASEIKALLPYDSGARAALAAGQTVTLSDGTTISASNGVIIVSAGNLRASVAVIGNQ